ncbi:hypothetical protein phiOC_p207 [Ochrobactrum phage vB_OspM_OC]|nr:hypothetical protein phiOC_p207 [Ochrobactrum phage vB_OspM_OC]
MTIKIEKVRLESLRAFVSFLKDDIFKDHSYILQRTGFYTTDTAWFDFSNLDAEFIDFHPKDVFVGLLLTHEGISRLYAIPCSLISTEFIDILQFYPLLNKEEDNMIAHIAHAHWAKDAGVVGVNVISQTYDNNKVSFTIDNREAVESEDYKILHNDNCALYEIPVRYSSHIATLKEIEHDLDYIAINSVIEYQKNLAGLQKKTGNDIFKETSI